MMDIREIRNSGMLELYVVGDLTDEEMALVEAGINASPELKEEVVEIERSFEQYALANAIAPDATIKPMLCALVDYMTRLENGEKVLYVPSLIEESKGSDFDKWLDRDDMQEPDEYESMHGKIIGASDEKTTLIVWLKHGAPDETHTDELEKFLILEGTCNITIGDKVHSLVAGDYLSIPLFINHRVEVTSSTRCKVILERAAA